MRTFSEMFKFVVVVLALAAIALAMPTERVAMETDMMVSSEWVQGERADPTLSMKLTFALHMRNIAELERIALAVSDPSKPDTYGHHLTRSEVDALTAPTEQQLATVERWLRSNGVANVQRTSSMVIAYCSVEKASELLATEFFVFSHERVSGQTLVRALDYSLPRELANLVAFVGGVKHFPRVQTRRVERSEASKRLDLWVDPSVIAERYQTSGAKSTATNNSQAVTQFLGQYADSADLDEFFLLFARDSLGSKPTFVGPDGIFAGLEASLDIQYIMSVGTDTPTWFWSLPNNNQTNEEPFLTWLEELENTSSVPILWSVSYGEPEWAVASNYLQYVNAQFAKMAARGLTIFFASGDSGADCQPNGKQFAPDFPSSCPWVTTIGGTTFDLSQGSSAPETVNALSGGGFSNVFSLQTWQADAVAGYLNSSVKLPKASFFNASGRAYPDASALSADFIIVIDLLPQPGVAGTSCASPTTAGVFGLLNDLRLNAGQSALGFLNPAIYSTLSSGFTDVTDGSNSGSSEGTACDGVGFRATKGWDPASGFGSPNYQALSSLVTSALPAGRPRRE